MLFAGETPALPGLARSYVWRAPMSGAFSCLARSYVWRAPMSSALPCLARSCVWRAPVSGALLCLARSYVWRSHAAFSPSVLFAGGTPALPGRSQGKKKGVMSLRHYALFPLREVLQLSALECRRCLTVVNTQSNQGSHRTDKSPYHPGFRYRYPLKCR